MLIVEGPDGGGKTRLIERLSKSLEWPVAPRVVSKDAEAMVDLVKWVEENLEGDLQPVIYDRHRLISEPIYGPLLRGDMEEGFCSLPWLRDKQTWLRSINPFVIFCLPPLETVHGNIREDPDNTVVWGRINQIYWLYHNLAASWPGTCATWDYTEDDYHRLFTRIYYWAFREGLKSNA